MLDTTLRDAEKIDSDTALVVLAIGRNNLRSGYTDFKEHLELLLKRVCKPGRRVVMVELPLPPFFNLYGSAQRNLARRHGVTLIPKRFLASVLADPDASTDGLHLSDKGQALLAERLGLLFDTAH